MRLENRLVNMNEILDEDLTPKRPDKRSIYGRYSNIPAAIVILSALFKIMHWPYGDELLILGISAHLGIELGYLFVLKGKSKLNLRRFGIALFFFIMITRLWRIGTDFLHPYDWTLIFSILLVCAGVTYYFVLKQLKERKL